MCQVCLKMAYFSIFFICEDSRNACNIDETNSQ